MLRGVPVKKLSTHSTWHPAASKRSHKWDPRKPAPPVTSARRSKCILQFLLVRFRLGFDIGANCVGVIL